jgi:hypothetical protein
VIWDFSKNSRLFKTFKEKARLFPAIWGILNSFEVFFREVEALSYKCEALIKIMRLFIEIKALISNLRLFEDILNGIEAF